MDNYLWIDVCDFLNTSRDTVTLFVDSSNENLDISQNELGNDEQHVKKYFFCNT